MEAAHQSGRSSVRARAYRTLRPGTRVDRYRLLAPLGEGGQAAVWQAEDPLAPGELRAIKLIDLARATPSDRERTRREARALLDLEHVSLCRPYGLFEDLDHEVLGLVMEHVDGSALANLLADRRLTSELRDTILGHIVAVLAHVHARGVVHRDLKPENILIASAFWSAPNDASHVKLVDFGIAASMRPATRLTAPGFAIGTPPYMAPERIEPSHWGGAPDSPAGDVFSWGILAWRVLGGIHPVGLSEEANLSDYAVAYRMAAKEGNWPPLLPAPSRLGCGISRCVALRAGERWASAVELAGGLGISVEKPARRARREKPAIEPSNVSTQPWVLPPTQEPEQPRLAAPLVPPTVPEAPLRTPVRKPRAARWWWLGATALVLGGLLGATQWRQDADTEESEAEQVQRPPLSERETDRDTLPPRPQTVASGLYLQVSSFPDQKGAIRQAEVFRRGGLEPTVFWTTANNYVVTLGPFGSESVRTSARERFLKQFPGYEALPQDGGLYDVRVWPER